MSKMPNVNVDRIKSLAKEQGMTMKFLNKMLGKNDSFLSNVRLGNMVISNHELAIIARELKTTVDYLTDKTEDPSLPGGFTEADEEVIGLGSIRFAFSGGDKAEFSEADKQAIVEFARFLRQRKREREQES